MHGAGGYQAQCGLVEGPLLFIGIYSRLKEISDEKTVELCHDFAASFDRQFGSLTCKDLRPGGFQPDDPDHLCESLTIDAVVFTIEFVSKKM